MSSWDVMEHLDGMVPADCPCQIGVSMNKFEQTGFDSGESARGVADNMLLGELDCGSY